MVKPTTAASQLAIAAAEVAQHQQTGNLERADLQRGAERILEILRKTDTAVEGVEVNIFRPWGLKEWRGLQQTVRAGATDKTNTSAMEIPSAHLMDATELETRAWAAIHAFKALDETVNGLTLSVYKRDAQGKLQRQSAAVEYAWLPPEPPIKTVYEIEREERSLVNDPFGFGTGVAFPS